MLGGGAALAAGVLVGLVLWRFWLPQHRPDRRPGERYGIDVSNHQGTIDWSAVAGDDIEFAYVKATEGGDHVDARFVQNWAGARDAGLEVGAYHFFTLCRPGADQARHLLRVAPEAGDLPHAVDLELGRNCSARPHAEHVRREVDTFLRLVEEATGEPVALYVGDDWEERYPTRGRGDRPDWRRSILARPGGDWWIWQVSGEATVAGVDGPVDLNVMRTEAR